MSAAKTKTPPPSGKVKVTYVLPEKLADRIAFAALRRKLNRSAMAEELLTLALRRTPPAAAPNAEAETETPPLAL